MEPELNIQQISDVLVGFKHDQRVGRPFTVTVMNSGLVLVWVWELREYWTNDLVRLSFSKNPQFTVNTRGVYTLVMRAYSLFDTVIRRFEGAFVVDSPRVSESECQYLVDGSVTPSTGFFRDFGGVAEGTTPELVIGLKGTINGLVQILNTVGDAQPVRFQCFGQVTINANNTHALWLSDRCRNVIVDGYDENGDPALTINGSPVSSHQPVFVTGNDFTKIWFKGLKVNHQLDKNCAAIAMVPNISATNNATTTIATDCMIYDCTGADCGEEFVYAGYNSDTPIGGFIPPKLYRFICAYNAVVRCGRDAYQFGSVITGRVHNNIGDQYGMDGTRSHESAISSNGGNADIIYFQNVFTNGKMLYNVQSGATPWNIFAGETSPTGPVTFLANTYVSGVYPPGQFAEPYAIFTQNSPNSGPGNWYVQVLHNTADLDKKFAALYFHANSFNSANHRVVNNILVFPGGGIVPEVEMIGPAAGDNIILVNNLLRDTSQRNTIQFVDFPDDLSIASFSSPAYSATSINISTFIDARYQYDLGGYPLLAPGHPYTYGAWSGYQKRIIPPFTSDPFPAAFTMPVSVASITGGGGAVAFEADKACIFYYVVSSSIVAPSKTQIMAGQNHQGAAANAWGTVENLGTVTPQAFTGCAPLTKYFLYGFTRTADGIDSGIQRVPFTTVN